MTVNTAIAFLALLAYPEEPKGRKSATDAMRAYYLRECRKAGTLTKLPGGLMQQQQMENQIHRLKQRLDRRLNAADDCVLLDLGLQTPDGVPFTLNNVSLDREISGHTQRYKQDWWRPQVMHMAIALRSVRMFWNDPRPYCLLPRTCAANQIDPGWICPYPFTVETLILMWPDWIAHVMGNSPFLAAYLRDNPAPPLRGFKATEFLFPDP